MQRRAHGAAGGERKASALSNRYGHFSADGREFVITDPRPPRPWTNIVANPHFGLAVSQTGSGFSWIGNSQLGTLTRWQQDLALDCSGRFLYARDAESGEVWSLAPAPVWPRYERYACRHGFGFTAIETELAGIGATWTLLCPVDDAAELWLVELHNAGPRPRRVELTGFVEWCMGTSPSPRREFHKLFLETAFDAERRAVFACNHMWDVPSQRFGHWNTDFPFTAAFACSEPLTGAEGDRVGFFGRYRDPRSPIELATSEWNGSFGRHDDPVAALRCAVALAPGERRSVVFTLAADESRAGVERLLEAYREPAAAGRALAAVTAAWADRLAAHRIETPDPGLDRLVNDWSRYQAISARLWGRCGYYQQSGAFGFRDQLQDSQVWLTIAPERCRAQIDLHAAHQFRDGSVYHWWHPLSEQGHVTRMTDDLLWLPFVTAAYLKETGDLSVLDDRAPFLDDPTARPLRDHIDRAFARVFERTSARGLPYIGAGDWNDGLSAVGLAERGEAVWLAQLLAGLLVGWAEVHRRCGEREREADFARRRAALVDAINTHAWDGEWYLRATLDDGTPLGSSRNRVGRIFLNAQVWAILNDIAPPDRAAACMDAVRLHHPLCPRPARERRRLHPRRHLGHRRRRQGEGRRARRPPAHRDQPRRQGPRALLGRALRPPRQRRWARLPPPRPRRLDVVHRLGGVVAPRRHAVGARRAAGVGRPPHRPLPAARVGSRDHGTAVPRRNAHDRHRSRHSGGRAFADHRRARSAPHARLLDTRRLTALRPARVDGDYRVGRTRPTEA